MLPLSLRLTIVGDRPLPDDFVVIWTSDAFGARRVGRIRLATEHAEKERWEWTINLPMPVPSWGRGIARSRPMANAAFQRSFYLLASNISSGLKSIGQIYCPLLNKAAG